MRYNIIVVGFFDAMGAAAMDFIFNQTEMTSVVSSEEYIPKFIQMKKDGQASFVKHVISLGDIKDPDQVEACNALGLTITLFKDVIKDGSEYTDAPEFTVQDKMQSYMFSYTSGTTGDSKGVKMTHNMIVR